MKPFETDIRKPADPDRKRAFVRGFNDSATGRHDEYGENALQHLTWQNLGYRLGLLFGETDKELVHRLFDWCEEQQRRALGGSME